MPTFITQTARPTFTTEENIVEFGSVIFETMHILR